MAEVSAMAALDPPVGDEENALETSSTPSPCTSQAVQQQEQLAQAKGSSMTDELKSMSQARSRPIPPLTTLPLEVCTVHH